MLKTADVVTEVEYHDDLQVVVVRTEHHTNFEAKLKKRTQTSGCAQGTAFGDLLEAVESVALPQAQLRTSWLYQMTHAINTMPFARRSRSRRDPRLRRSGKQGTPVCHTEDAAATTRRQTPAGSIAMASIPPTRSFTPRDGDLRDGDQDGADGIPILVSRRRLHRLGRRSGEAGRIGPWSVVRAEAVHRAVGRRAHHLRPEARLCRRGIRAAQAQGEDKVKAVTNSARCLLAGGLARRMGGGDKPMREIGGRTILERVIARPKPQCSELVLNANGDPARFARFQLPVISDTVENFPVPLAGIPPRSIGWRQPAGRSLCAKRGGGLPVPAARSGGATVSGAQRKNAQLAVAASADSRIR